MPPSRLASRDPIAKDAIAVLTAVAVVLIRKVSLPPKMRPKMVWVDVARSTRTALALAAAVGTKRASTASDASGT